MIIGIISFFQSQLCESFERTDEAVEAERLLVYSQFSVWIVWINRMDCRCGFQMNRSDPDPWSAQVWCCLRGSAPGQRLKMYYKGPIFGSYTQLMALLLH